MASTRGTWAARARPSGYGRFAAAACCVMALSGLSACQSKTTFRTVDLSPPERITQDIPETQVLDVGIVVFDGNIPETFDAVQQILLNAEVRRAESYYMPYMLKSVVESTGNWGAVRVVPDDTLAVDLLVTGKILESQGERLSLRVTARDARGVVWFDDVYEGLTSKYAYGDALPRDADPFQHVYTQIADDLAAHFVALGEDERHAIRLTAKMQFAREMLPDAYTDYVQPTEEGGLALRRLPAEDDPMMGKVERVREREFMFIDTLEGHYAEYYRRVRPLYQTWRQAAYRESIATLELRAKRRRQVMVGTLSVIGGIAGGPATFAGISTGAEMLQASIGKQDEVQMHSEALREVSEAMESEVMPHTLELENKTVELTGTVEEQYAKLKRILKESYYESLGLAPPPAPIAAAP